MEEPSRLISAASERKSKVLRRRRTRTGTEMKKPGTITEAGENDRVPSATETSPVFAKPTQDMVIRVIYCM